LRYSAPCLLLLIAVVRQVGGQALAPVAAVIVNVDRIAEPLMEDLVAQRGLDDEREPHHILASRVKVGMEYPVGRKFSTMENRV